MPTMEMSTRCRTSAAVAASSSDAGRLDVPLAPLSGGQVQDRVDAVDGLGEAVAGEQVTGRQAGTAAPAQRADVVAGRA